MRKSLLVCVLLAFGNAYALEKAVKARLLPAKEVQAIQDALKKAGKGNADRGAHWNDFYYCSACHGPRGESPSSNWPSIAGSPPEYLFKTLKDYQAGARRGYFRPANLMHEVSRQLPDEHIADLAMYYSSQVPAASAKFSGTAKEFKLAKSLAEKGDPKRGIIPCDSCHQQSWTDIASRSVPRLNGQVSEYLQSAIWQYRLEYRTSDYNGIMQHQAKQLKSSEIVALSMYYAGLPGKRNQ